MWSEAEVCNLAETFKNMIAKEAWRVWKGLPEHTRVWVSLEDIMQDGMNKLVMEVIPKWDKTRGKLSTIICISLRNHFDEFYTVKYGASGRRCYLKHSERKVVGIEDLATERRNCWDVLHSMAPSLLYSNDIQGCFVVPMMMEIHKNSSETLQEEMVRWFFTADRLRLTTPKFKVSSKEFRGLAKKVGLDAEDCRHLFRSVECMDTLSRLLHHA